MMMENLGSNGGLNGDWAISKDNGGVLGADDYPERDVAMTPIRNDYRWTPACQRAFLSELACTGSVTRAARHVGKSARSAYDLRLRRDGAAFDLGWDAAILISRKGLQDMLMDRAVCGYEEMTVKQEDGTTMRGKYDNRLGIGLLNRLDRIAEAQAARGSQAAQVRLVTQDFESFLDLIERGGKGAEAALFCVARDDAPMPQMNPGIECELARESATKQAEAEQQEVGPEEAAATLLVWYDEDEQCWKTNFPPASDDDAEMVEENGPFGSIDYERTLTETEEAMQEAANRNAIAPWREAALAARNAWFGSGVAD
jgi:hypothetical protein